MAITATKSIDFCYGHRLLNYDGKCSMLHGHNGRVEIDYTVDVVGDDGFAIDFKDLKKHVGVWIDENIDHKTLIEKGDPIVKALADINEPHVVVAWRPTAENIARMIMGVAINHFGDAITSVRLWETPSSFVEVKR